jgi:Cyclin, N-terminal domain
MVGRQWPCRACNHYAHLTVGWHAQLACCIAQRVAIAALWLASKLEEAPKKFRDVLVVFARIDSRAEERPPELLDPNSQVCAQPAARSCFFHNTCGTSQLALHQHVLCILTADVC